MTGSPAAWGWTRSTAAPARTRLLARDGGRDLVVGRADRDTAAVDKVDRVTASRCGRSRRSRRNRGGAAQFGPASPDLECPQQGTLVAERIDHAQRVLVKAALAIAALLAAAGASAAPNSSLAGCTITGTSGPDLARRNPWPRCHVRPWRQRLISGLGGNDRLLGEAGDDSIHGGAGADLVDGGTGNDRLDRIGRSRHDPRRSGHRLRRRARRRAGPARRRPRH